MKCFNLENHFNRETSNGFKSVNLLRTEKEPNQMILEIPGQIQDKYNCSSDLISVT